MNYTEFFRSLCDEFSYEPTFDYEAFFNAKVLQEIGIKPETPEILALHEIAVVNCSQMPDGRELRRLASVWGLWEDPNLTAFEEFLNRELGNGNMEDSTIVPRLRSEQSRTTETRKTRTQHSRRKNP